MFTVTFCVLTLVGLLWVACTTDTTERRVTLLFYGFIGVTASVWVKMLLEAWEAL